MDFNAPQFIVSRRPSWRDRLASRFQANAVSIPARGMGEPSKMEQMENRPVAPNVDPWKRGFQGRGRGEPFMPMKPVMESYSPYIGAQIMHRMQQYPELYPSTPRAPVNRDTPFTPTSPEPAPQFSAPFIPAQGRRVPYNRNYGWKQPR